MIISSRLVFTYVLFVFIFFTTESLQALPDEKKYWPEVIACFEIFEDSLDLPFDSIRILNAGFFQDYNGHQLKRNKIYWLRIIIDNSTAKYQNNYIHFNSLVSNVKLYQNDENNNYTEKIGGTFVPENKRSVGGIIKEKVSFILSDGNRTELYIRVCTQVEMVYNLSGVEIISFEDYHQMIDRTFLIQAFFLGIIVVLLLLNLTLFILTQDKLYLFYLLYIFFTSLFFINYYQLSEKYLLFNFPKIDLSLSISLTIAEAIYLWFFYEVLKNEALPVWREFIRKVAIIVTIFCLIICSIMLFDYYYAVLVNDFYSLLNGVFIVTIFIILYRRVSKAIKIIIAGTFIMVICGIIAIVLDFSKAISSNVVLYQIGVFIELILFSVAVIHIYNKERLDNMEVQLIKCRLEVNQVKKDLENRNLTEKLAMKNRDLVSKEIIISREKAIIDEAAKHLLNLNGKGIENSPGIKRIIKRLQVNGNNDNWKEFELHFRKIHPRFYSILIKEHPSLTRNDIKLCAFIKLNLSTKQIAEINGKSQNTIDVARYRLRKKLGLQNGNLTSFIAAIG